MFAMKYNQSINHSIIALFLKSTNCLQNTAGPENGQLKDNKIGSYILHCIDLFIYGNIVNGQISEITNCYLSLHK